MTKVKCVAWDLDDTVWDGVALEAPQLPSPRPRVLELMAELEGRGILNSIASRSDPSLLERLREWPELYARVVAPHIGWAPKSATLTELADHLNVSLDAVVLVDEDPFTRAEVEHMTPEVRTLSLAALESALAEPEFSPPATAEAGRRVEMYREEERRRRAGSEFSGSQTDFFASCGMRLEIVVATPGDLPRLAELAERSHRLNSTGEAPSTAELSARISSPGHLVVRARLTDRFGDYGTIGLLTLARGPDEWRLETLAVSCRVEGRGVPGAVLAWAMAEAGRAGARTLAADYRASDRNLRLGLLYRQLGFRGSDPLRRDLTGELPGHPDWLEVSAPVTTPR
ncbi:MAG TPA: HAD-IIIC family phosphatase [Candidatus Dormibacteraeota bacterium]|jgi:FkbH-like protein|nr:HAD-IIIC family phosphatase [Candidatus Dormibacteraeota bacterium]